MIARFLSGKATPEEELAVLDYMSENDERIEDLLAMSAAVEQYKESKQRQKYRKRCLVQVRKRQQKRRKPLQKDLFYQKL